MVSAPVAQALTEMGYTSPTPIQEAVIGPMLNGVDLVGQAQTGTGKTAGFGIPLAERVDGGDGYAQAIVLVPTRELARQVIGELSRIVRYRGIRLVAVYGGAPMAPQIARLEGGAQIIVGTPGRVIDLLGRGNLRIDRVQTVILDEADQMLDIGFLPDIRRILTQHAAGSSDRAFHRDGTEDDQRVDLLVLARSPVDTSGRGVGAGRDCASDVL